MHCSQCFAVLTNRVATRTLIELLYSDAVIRIGWHSHGNQFVLHRRPWRSFLCILSHVLLLSITHELCNALLGACVGVSMFHIPRPNVPQANYVLLLPLSPSCMTCCDCRDSACLALSSVCTIAGQPKPTDMQAQLFETLEGESLFIC